MDLDHAFKDRLKWALETREPPCAQAELGKAVGISAQAVQQWAAGVTTSPRRDKLVKAADFLGVRLDWLAYARGPMRTKDVKVSPGMENQPEVNGEVAILASNWEKQLVASLPAGYESCWQKMIPHPLAPAQIRVEWDSPEVLGSIGLYQTSAGLVQSLRQKLYHLLLISKLLPQVAGRRLIMIIAPLESWREPPGRHLDALTAEARVLGVEVVLVKTPEQAAAVLTGKAEAATLPVADELGLDIPVVL